MRIKYLLFTALFAGLVSCDSEQHQFTVIGEITGLPEGDIFLEEVAMDGLIVVDSAKSAANGKFELSGTAPEPAMYRLRFPQNRFVLLSIKEGNLKVKGDWQQLESSYTVSGSPSSESLKQMMLVMRNHMSDLNRMQVVLDSLRRNGDSTKLASATASVKDMNIQLTRYLETYADTTKSLPNALFATQILSPQLQNPFLESFIAGLDERFPNSKLAEAFKAKYEESKAAAVQNQNGLPVGIEAPEISLSTPDGKQVRLSSYRGKYVLVDFWASWCGPCRQENPNVVKAYNQFKGDKFAILGVSLDNDKDKWEKAIAQDGLTWTHISDLKGWQSIAARDYNVNGIPANFLVDPEGKIVATNLRGEELAGKLAEVLN